MTRSVHLGSILPVGNSQSSTAGLTFVARSSRPGVAIVSDFGVNKGFDGVCKVVWQSVGRLSGNADGRDKFAMLTRQLTYLPILYKRRRAAE